MDAEKDSRKGGTKTVVVVLAVLVVLIFGFLFITGKFPTHTKQTPGAAESYAVVQENKQALEDCITEALDAETAKARFGDHRQREQRRILREHPRGAGWRLLLPGGYRADGAAVF